MLDDVGILEEFSQRRYGLPFVFSNIALETSSFCNRGCGFCPVGITRKPVTRLEDELLEKVFCELAEIGYVGEICFNWYNEPLADRRLPSIISSARTACPDSFLYFSSNGDLLTPQLFRELVDAGLDRIQVSQYDGVVADNVQATEDAGKHVDSIRVQLKGPRELINARGGSVPALQLTKPLAERCIRPDEQLIVSATGDVPLCCNDYYVMQCAGNIRNSTLLELWNATTFREAREPLRRGDRTATPICRACNEPDSPYNRVMRNFKV